MSFTVKVRAGITLNQLRLVSGQARLSDDELLELSTDRPDRLSRARRRSRATRGRRPTGCSSASTCPDEGSRSPGTGPSGAARCSSSTGSTPTRSADFWERVEPKDGRLILDSGEFYLLVSRERVRIPPDYAAEMAAYDPTSGELRTHYAGFFDPGFGDVRDGDAPGTPAVLEVRAHDVPFSLEHGQRLCKLTFERMSTRPDELYGAGDRLALSAPVPRPEPSIPRRSGGRTQAAPPDTRRPGAAPLSVAGSAGPAAGRPPRE